MTDHLKEIWSRFEESTSRNLTGSGVDNIPRPVTEEMERHRSLLENAHEAASVPMPEGVTEPAEAAFAALRERLTSFDKKGKVQNRQQDLSVPVMEQDKLTQDLKTTENLTVRREMDYLNVSHQYQAGKGRDKRKKFLGIF